MEDPVRLRAHKSEDHHLIWKIGTFTLAHSPALSGFSAAGKNLNHFRHYCTILTMTFASIKFDLSCLRHGHFPSLPELSAVLSVMAPGPPETPARKNLHATSWLDCGSSKGNAGISMPCSICLLHLLELTIQEANHRISWFW